MNISFDMYRSPLLAAAIAALASTALPPAIAHAESRGPFVALDKAHAAADKESDRAHAEDATAATLGAATVPVPANPQDAGAANVPDSATAQGAANAAGAGSASATGAANAAGAANPSGATNSAGAVGAANAVPSAAIAAGDTQGAPADAAANAGGTADAKDAAGAPAADTAVETASYDPAKHRDPFRPPGLTAPVVDNSPRTPLERYELGQLKLVGVVTASAGGARAMVEDSSGLGYIVTTGTPIGSTGGVVTRIEPRRVLIEEKVANYYGEKEPKQFVMELPKEDRSP